MKTLTISLASLGLLAALGAAPTVKSGPQVGERVTAFEPYHVTGADAGTNTCPVCKYGMLPNVQLWINHESEANTVKFAELLEDQMTKHSAEKLKSFVVFVKPSGVSDEAEKAKLKGIAEKAHVKHVAFVFCSLNDDFVLPYKINPAAKSTLFVTKKRLVIENLVNAAADDSRIVSAIDQAVQS